MALPRATFEFIENELARFFESATTKNGAQYLSRAEIVSALESDEHFQKTLTFVNLTQDSFVEKICATSKNKSNKTEGITLTDFRQTMESMAESVQLNLDSLALVLNRRRLRVPVLENLAREASSAFQRVATRVHGVEQRSVGCDASALTVGVDELCQYVTEDQPFKESVHSVGISIFTVSNLLSRDAKRRVMGSMTIRVGEIDFVSPFKHALEHAKAKRLDDDTTLIRQCVADIAKDDDPTEWYNVGIAALAVLGGH